MAYSNPEVKKAKAREAYKAKRESELREAGIDPSLVPVRADGKRGISIKKRKDSSLPEWLVLELVRKPNESDDDWRRRKSRTKVNFYNSRMTPEQRAEKNARVRATYDEQVDKMRARRKELYYSDPERHREYGRKYFLKNKEERLLKLAEWSKKNPDKVKAAKEKWADENRALLAQYSADYRAKLVLAAPDWTDWDAIYWLYEEARKRTEITGVKTVVDHIIPLNHENVCGIHVWWNLRVITETENCRKSNRWSQEDGIAPMSGD